MSGSVGHAEAMSDDDKRELIRRYLDASGVDQDISHETYHDDAVLEFPQSGERFEGVAHFREWRRQYPAEVTFTTRDLRGAGALWVAELAVDYDGGSPLLGVSILEFRGDKVARETIYTAEPWEAPDWRKPWRSAP